MTNEKDKATEALTDKEFYARGLARSRYHDRLFAEGRPRPTNEQFDEGWAAARTFYATPPSAAPVVDKAFDVKWRRPNESEILECHGLTAALLVFRIRAAIRMSGSVELLSVEPKEVSVGVSEPSVSNHVFTCSACGRQWTVDSQDALECFFVGVCYWCIRKHKLTKAELDNHLRSLLPAAATAAPQQSEHKMLHYFTPSERGDTCLIYQRGVLEHPETPKHNLAAAPVEQSEGLVKIEKLTAVLDQEFTGVLTTREAIGQFQRLLNWQSPDPENTITLGAR